MPLLAIWTIVLDWYAWFHQAFEPLGDYQSASLMVLGALWIVMAFTRNAPYYLRWVILIVIGMAQLSYFLAFQTEAFWMFHLEEAGFWLWALSYLVLFYFGLKQVIYYTDLLDDGKYRARTRYAFSRGLYGWAFLVFIGAFSLWVWEWLLNVVVVVFVLSQLWQWTDVVRKHEGFLRPTINFWFYFFGAMSIAVVGAYLMVSLVIAIFWILVTLLALLVVFLVGYGAYTLVRRRRLSATMSDEAATIEHDDETLNG